MHMIEYHYVNHTYGMVPGERANRTSVTQKLSFLITLSKRKECLHITIIILERARREKPQLISATTLQQLSDHPRSNAN